MSRPDSSNSPAPDIYTGLLFVSVAALVTGIILLAMELNKYSWEVAT